MSFATDDVAKVVKVTALIIDDPVVEVIAYKKGRPLKKHNLY